MEKYFVKITSPVLLMLFTILLLVLQQQFNSVFNYTQIVFFSLGLFFVGIPHGALDNIVESGDLKKGIELQFILKYLLKAALFFIVWLLLPNIALLLFLVYSAIHFGQSDMNEWNLNVNKKVKSLVWGILVLSIILIGHVTETNNVLKNMNVSIIPLAQNSSTNISIYLSLLSIAWGVYERKLSMVIICITLLFSIKLPLLTAFGIYFIGQHSITGWIHLKNTFQSTNLSLFKKALPYNLGVCVLFCTYLIFFNGIWISSFFIFISCISLPHVIAMNTFYSKFWNR